MRILRLEVSVHNGYTTNQFQTTFARGGGGRSKNSLGFCPNYVQEFGLRMPGHNTNTGDLPNNLGDPTEYAQSGNSRFLAYIPSWWKNLAWLGRVGGSRQPSFTLFPIMYKVVVYPPAERADTLPVFHLYPMYASPQLTCATSHSAKLRQSPLCYAPPPRSYS